MTHREETTHDSHSEAGDGHVEGLRGGQTGLFEKVGRVPAKGIAVESLDAINADDDHGPAEVCALEARAVRRCGIDGTFVFRRGDH